MFLILDIILLQNMISETVALFKEEANALVSKRLGVLDYIPIVIVRFLFTILAFHSHSKSIQYC